MHRRVAVWRKSRFFSSGEFCKPWTNVLCSSEYLYASKACFFTFFSSPKASSGNDDIMSFISDPPSLNKRLDSSSEFIRFDEDSSSIIERIFEWLSLLMQPIETQENLLRYFRHQMFPELSVIGWGIVIFLYGSLIRFITMIPSLYGTRNARRLNLIAPQLNNITRVLQSAKSDKLIDSSQKLLIKERCHKMKKKLYKINKCSRSKSMLNLFFSPLTAMSFIAIRNLATSSTDLKMSSFLWIRDLSIPDPWCILPVICTGLFLVNYHLNQQLQVSSRGTSGLYLRWAIHVGILCGCYLISNQPAALCVYWIGLSLSGTLQPILLRSTAFCNFFNFPPLPKIPQDDVVKPEKILFFSNIYRFLQKIIGSDKNEVPPKTTLKTDSVKLQHINEFDFIENSSSHSL